METYFAFWQEKEYKNQFDLKLQTSSQESIPTYNTYNPTNKRNNLLQT